MKYINIKNILIVLFFILLPKVSGAANFSFVSTQTEFGLSNDFTVQVVLNTEGELVNAFEGIVTFPSDVLELKEVRDGNSVVNFWIEKPRVVLDGNVPFSGVTVGGFNGANKYMFSLVFRPKKVGSEKLSIGSMRVLLNDGQGSQVESNATAFNFKVVEKITNEVEEVKDTTAPEDFLVSVSKDQGIFEGKAFIVFNASDKGEGIDHYEVRESLLGFDGKYETATSPYVLKDQNLNKTIYVKAVDKNGNYKIEKINPSGRPIWLYYFILFIVITLIIIFFVHYKKKEKIIH